MKPINSQNYFRNKIVVIAAVILMAGCASTPPPTEQMATSRAAISNANSAEASAYAPLQLKAAMEKMEAAERAMVEKNYTLARTMAEQAQVDAQLAAETSRSAKTQKAAQTIQEDSHVLREELDRKVAPTARPQK